MEIVVLDGNATNPGDLSWQSVSALGKLTVYDRTPDELIISRIGSAEAVLTNKCPIGQAVLDACPNLKYIGVLATGYNVIDTAAAKARGVIVTNIPAYSTASVTQFVFALLLEYCHHVAHHAEAVRQGRWSDNPDFTFWDTPLVELAGKTFAVVGLGQIGRSVAAVAAALGMKVLAVAHRPEAVKDPGGFELVTLDEAFKRADVLSLHTPLTAETKNIINAENIAKMKNGAVLINTARGGLVNERDLRRGLESGKPACYLADVLTEEPPKNGSVLIGAPNCVLTPHIAWAPRETRARLMGICADNIAAWFSGSPKNVVNP